MSTEREHPPLVVNGGDEGYRHFELEQVGWGVVAKVESVSDFPDFPFMLAAAPEMRAVLERLTRAAQHRDNHQGDPMRLIETRAELEAAAKEACKVLSKARNGSA